MSKLLAFFITIGFVFIMEAYIPVAQSQESFVTLLSSPGKLEIVRHPTAADYSISPGKGKISSLPSYDPNSRKGRQVDIRSCDLSSLDLQDRLNDLLQADFDSKTVWPAELPPDFDFKRIMELGKNPGLGVREIHSKGINGDGVGIAIIDQPLLVDHEEYKNQLRLYEEIHWQKDSEASMHGPAVASIAVGKTVGVAPEADLYFIAEWHGKLKPGGGFEMHLPPLAESIDRIIEINKILPKEKRIRVISISLGINPKMSGYDSVMISIENAKKEGIYTVYVESDPFYGLNRKLFEDPDQFASYSPGQFWISYWESKKSYLMVPMNSRCTAAPNGESDYVFYRSGGMSWAVPWVAGLYALACQVNPDVTPKIFWDAAQKTSVIAKAEIDGKIEEFGRIINPEALIEELKKI